MAQPGGGNINNNNNNNNNDNSPSYWMIAAGFAAGIGIGAGAGYGLYKAFQGETKEIPAASCSHDTYKECALCNQPIFKGLKKLQCGHFLHEHCFNIVKDDSRKCPECGFVLREKAGVDNRANQLNPNNFIAGPGRPAGYSGAGDKYDLDNHANQKNPNHPLYRGENGFKALQGKTEKIAVESDDDDIDYDNVKGCAVCDGPIFKGLMILQCGHYLHDDCFEVAKGVTLVLHGSHKCPASGCGSVLRVRSGVENRSRQLNFNHRPTKPGHRAGYHGTGDKYDLDNHSNQKNPNHSLYQGGYGFK